MTSLQTQPPKNGRSIQETPFFKKNNGKKHGFESVRSIIKMKTEGEIFQEKVAESKINVLK